MKKTVGILLTVVLILVLSVPALAEFVKTPADDGSLNVRQGPGTSYEVVGWVKNGQKITVLESAQPWSKIQVDATGKVGYINAKYIVAEAPQTTPAPVESVELGKVATKYAGSTVNVRKGPGTAYDVAYKLLSGTELTIRGASGNWYLVTYAGKAGYISKNYTALGVSRATTAAVHFRAGAGSGYASNGVLAKGTKVVATGVVGNWTAVTVDGKTGFIYSRYLK